MTPRVALVTGSGRGIGRAIAQRLSSDGRAVAIADVSAPRADETAELITKAGGRAVAVRMDVTSGASVADAVAEASERLGGPIEIVVNNAGWDEHRRFLDTDEEFWNTVIEINYKGVLRVCKAVVPGMVDRGWGRVVNIGSDAARVGSSLEAVYSGAKGGVLAFSKALAREVARSGVTVNCVCPGPTQTPLLHEIVQSGTDAQKVIESMTRAVPMKRLAKPEEIAVGVALFAADDAGYITGQTLSVSGGLTMA